jgi:hypothetical protein
MIYTVTGYERTTVMMRVEADGPGQAIEKAQRGEYDAVDTEPGPRLLRPAWSATEGWPYGDGPNDLWRRK